MNSIYGRRRSQGRKRLGQRLGETEAAFSTESPPPNTILQPWLGFFRPALFGSPCTLSSLPNPPVLPSPGDSHSRLTARPAPASRPLYISSPFPRPRGSEITSSTPLVPRNPFKCPFLPRHCLVSTLDARALSETLSLPLVISQGTSIPMPPKITVPKRNTQQYDPTDTISCRWEIRGRIWD